MVLSSAFDVLLNVAPEEWEEDRLEYGLEARLR